MKTSWLPWQVLRLTLGRQNLPGAAMQSWLREEGSLTRRLRATTGGVAVNLRGAGWGFLDAETARAMDARAGSRVWMRHVSLHCESLEWFQAVTYIPQHSLAGETRRLRRWGNRSLGDFLFAPPGPCRSIMTYALLRTAEEYWWARRCCHYRYNRPILVCEYFAESSPCASHR